MHRSILLVCVVLATSAAARAKPDAWRFTEEFRPYLIKGVPGILKSQDQATGRFGTGVWIVNDQNAIFPLAVAWNLPGNDNPWHHSPEVLNAIMAGGDALIPAQDAKGMFEFRKKDNSTWGRIYMPWTYSRWIRAYAIIKDAMPNERRERWEKALRLGFEGIDKSALTSTLNIPAHHAMALYCAGQTLSRPDWMRHARTHIHRVLAAQSPGGYWTEHSGPVVMYNNVYVDALGAYYRMSGDKAVLPALERAARFHAALTYPDGTAVETVDERNGWSPVITMPNFGFTFSPAGRGYARQQWERLKGLNKPLVPDVAAGYLLYGEEGPVADSAEGGSGPREVLDGGRAIVLRNEPWFACLSGYTAPIAQNRWIQDRQNLVSVFHRKAGLILGGGNTKLQPLFSTFTVGDTSRFYHRPGDGDPNFRPPAGVFTVPSAAKIEANTLSLTYGDATCSVTVDLADPARARITYACANTGDASVAAHLPLIARLNKAWKTASGRSGILGDHPVMLEPGEAGAWFQHAGWRISVPPTASLSWPVLPHDQYKKDGSATTAQGRIVLTVPLAEAAPSQRITLEPVP